MTRKGTVPDLLLRLHFPILHFFERRFRIVRGRMARGTDRGRARRSQRDAGRIRPKAIGEAGRDEEGADDEDEDDGDAAVAARADGLVGIDVAVLVVGVDAREEDGLRDEPVQDAGEGHERQRVGVWQLEEVGAALDADGRRHAQGLALPCVASPFAA